MLDTSYCQPHNIEGGSRVTNAEHPLTTIQAVEAIEQLRTYFSEIYRHGAPFKLPTFRMILRNCALEEAPTNATRITRRSEGTHADPTPMAAIINLEGVTLQMPEVQIIGAGDITSILTAMPSHLELALRCAIIGEVQTPTALLRFAFVYEAAAHLAISQSTIFRRCNEALEWVASALYGERWTSVFAEVA
jgi:hypothetical protein